jgi:predicted transcriptional regulator
MKKTTNWFYTPAQEKRMIEVYKTSKNQAEASKKLATELKRNPGTIQVKLSKLLRGDVSKRKQEPKGVLIPQGFTFDIKPTKAVMFQDHVRLYF